MKYFLEKLAEKQSLNREEAFDLIIQISDDQVNLFQAAAIMGFYNSKTVTPDELIGFREGLLSLALPVSLDQKNVIDVCGTGGDGKDTFNISTLSAFVLAGAGIPVAKHGNHGVSGISGSSTVLEYLGIQFTSEVDQLNLQLEKANCCFLHAPLFHPALKNVALIRKQLGVKTFFNLLGPLVNPAHPIAQVIGVYKPDLLRTYSHILQEENKRYIILHSTDGYDEVSLTGPVKLFSDHGEEVINAPVFNVNRLNASDLYGGATVEKSAEIFLNVLQNTANKNQLNVVCANAAIGIRCYFSEISYTDAFSIAEESIISKRAFQCFKSLKECL